MEKYFLQIEDMIPFYIYYFVIRKKLENEMKNVNNPKLNYIDKIIKIFLKNNNDIYNLVILNNIIILFKHYRKRRCHSTTQKSKILRGGRMTMDKKFLKQFKYFFY